MTLHRRDWIRLTAAGVLAAGTRSRGMAGAVAGAGGPAPLTITGLRVTPIALPDPPLLNAGGCHGPYFLRNVVELETEGGGGVVGIGETSGGNGTTRELERARALVVGRNAFAYREFGREVLRTSPAAYAAVELACLDACGRATGRRLCELLGGPVRDPVEFAAYLFYRYAADHPTILADPHRVDLGARGAIDGWGEVRSPSAMAAMARAFRDRWGFRVFKLKGGVLTPDLERETLKAMAATLGGDCPLRIDPNGRWRVETAIRVGKAFDGLTLEYYEDPVRGQEAMAAVRTATGRPLSTNMCVTRYAHIPGALRLKPIDVLLTDLHYWGGFAGCQALGPIAEVAGWTLSQHSNNHAGVTMAAMIHLAAVLPQLTMASDTHYPWLPDDADIIEGPKLAIRGGTMAIPPRPGLGVTLDRDKLARAHEVYQKCGVRGRDDATLMRKLEPGWTGDLL